MRMLFFTFTFVCCIVFLGTKEAGAEKVPYRSLIGDYENCLKTAALPSMVRKSYCLCTTVEMRNTLTMKQYLALAAQIVTKTEDNGKISQEKALSIKTIRTLAASCLQQVSDQM